MNILHIIVVAIVAYIVYVILSTLGLPSPLPMVIGLLVFLAGLIGDNWGGFRF